MEQLIHVERLDNGLVLLAEPMEWVESAAFALWIPAGCARDPSDAQGLNNLVCEMVQRGCGERDSREFLYALENLGVDYSASVSTYFSAFVGATEAANLPQALNLFAEMLFRPHFPESELESSRQVCLQEIRAFEDDLPRRLLARLRGNFYGRPHERLPHGMLEPVEAFALDDVRRQFQAAYVPQGSILSVAGRIDWPRLRDLASQAFGDWPAGLPLSIEESPVDCAYEHMAVDSSQTHLALAFPAPPADHDDYYLARSVSGVLGDGMSSRLFTHVREERGLCYTVDASYDVLPGRASVQCYAATTTERAQETLDVIMGELQRLDQGVDQGEVARLKARFKSSLIMQQESTAARCGAMASQWFLLGRVKTLQEVSRIIDDLSCDRVNEYLTRNPPRPRNVATLGAQTLETHVGVS